MLPQWALNLGPQPLGSEALLSEPLRHVLFDCVFVKNSIVKIVFSESLIPYSLLGVFFVFLARFEIIHDKVNWVFLHS